MKYGYTLIYVNDVMGTLEFYEKAFGSERGMKMLAYGYEYENIFHLNI